jgi:hypothetical protein
MHLTDFITEPGAYALHLVGVPPFMCLLIHLVLGSMAIIAITTSTGGVVERILL